MKTGILRRIANLLRRMANFCHRDEKEKPAPQRSVMSVTRSTGAVVSIIQWVAQALLTHKTPHPGHEDSVTVFVPQWDMKTVTEEGHKTFSFEALITTMRFSSFSALTGSIKIRPRQKSDSRLTEWIILEANFQLNWYGERREFKFDATKEKHMELSHLETHFRCYFERLLLDDKLKA